MLGHGLTALSEFLRSLRLRHYAPRLAHSSFTKCLRPTIFLVLFLAFLPVPVFPFVVTGEKNFPDSSLYRYHRGSYNYKDDVPIVRSYSNVFPRPLLKLLKEETRKSYFMKKGRTSQLKDGKGATHWTPMKYIENPRNAIEMAIAILFRYAFPDGKLPEGGIAGGEWWVQLRNTKENIGFHIDKDEGIASEEHWMKMPILSSVMYLTESGGPTFVLNQYTNRGGNKQVPPLPTEGFLVYPKDNRYMLFRGHLQHGVVGELSEGDVSAPDAANMESGRLTFLVNWWDEKPISPYCEPDSNAFAKSLRASELEKLHDTTKEEGTGETVLEVMKRDIAKGLETDRYGPHANNVIQEYPKFTEVANEDLAKESGIPFQEMTKLVDIQVPPTKRYLFPIPADIDSSHQLLGFRWPRSDVQGILRALDLTHNMCMNIFVNSAGWKVVLFRQGKATSGSGYGDGGSGSSSSSRTNDATPDYDKNVAYKVAKTYVGYDSNTRLPYIYVANSRDNRTLNLARSLFGLKPSAFRNSAGKEIPRVAVLNVRYERERKERVYIMPVEKNANDPGKIISFIENVMKVKRRRSKKEEL
eukprot:g1287.t1